MDDEKIKRQKVYYLPIISKKTMTIDKTIDLKNIEEFEVINVDNKLELLKMID